MLFFIANDKSYSNPTDERQKCVLISELFIICVWQSIFQSSAVIWLCRPFLFNLNICSFDVCYDAWAFYCYNWLRWVFEKDFLFLFPASCRLSISKQHFQQTFTMVKWRKKRKFARIVGEIDFEFKTFSLGRNEWKHFRKLLTKPSLDDCRLDNA